ncbi:hypothetical protein BDV96DRAFT_682204 [Lophiotrema nucula]|uniref:Fungal N-terminal domain-containing protein n=1 Tax=Lophiotrema nucula TaxID=690887 RepID=A0A6A5ZRA4_9PLEO|nr:hypothetical protein BDV96DRAFT_682204 [Lophiotrema nucula]
MNASSGQPDSPLSTTANVLGILTFALGLISFCAAFFAITHDAHREITDYQYSMREKKGHIDEIYKYFEELDIAADSELESSSVKTLIGRSVQDLERRRLAMERDLTQVRGRLQWWYRRKDMGISMARIETQLQHLGAIQLTFLLLKMKRQSTQLDELERLLGKLIAED